MSLSIGIDLGTTNTVLASGDRVLPIRVDKGHTHALASAVAFPPSGVVLVGSTAKRRRVIDPENTIVSSKRIIGAGEHSAALEDFRRRYASRLVVAPGRGPAFDTRRGPVTPTEIATFVLEAALRGAHVDPRTARAVVTVPAGFGEAQRQATLEAARAAGLHDVRILDEPVATAVAHGATTKARLAAVYDIGGGTFDFAVLETTERGMRVLAHGGDLFLGGDDVDMALARHAAEQLLRLHNWDLRADALAMDRLVAECELAKMRLTWDETTTLDLGQVDPDTPVDGAVLELRRADLTKAAADLVRRTFVTCDEVLARAGLSARAMDAVFLAGGTTLMPVVRQAVTAYFGTPPSEEVSPLDVVARGAALVAAA